ncbi:MAG: hypothetical protein JOZ19_15250 [Rubrobacter sp.]|nr:hypothetical protein [Rubrobacter sp.]
MTTEHGLTPEKETYERLLRESREMLSGAARTVLAEAQRTACAHYLVPS